MIGRNNYCAWGLTNNLVDNSDFYIEKIDKGNYFFGGKWNPLKERHESIKVIYKIQNKNKKKHLKIKG